MIFKKSKILLVEDDEMILEMYMKRFERENFSVKIAETGPRGISTAKEEIPNLILLDIILPEVDGFTVLKTLKSDKSTKGIPVIMLTNLGQDGDIKRGLELGAVDYLVKANYTPTQVVEKIKSYL